MPISPGNAYNLLHANPEIFLKRYHVSIAGSVQPSGPNTQFYLDNRDANAQRPGEILGTHRFHDTEAFKIEAVAGGYIAPGAQPFNAHSVHMDPDQARMGFYLLDGAGPDIMVTGQLTGCSFVIVPVPGTNNLQVAHVRPGGTIGSQLVTALSTAHPNAFVYGANDARGFYDSFDRRVTIIGKRDVNGRWSIYAQKQDKNNRIIDLYRIYPDHTKL